MKTNKTPSNHTWKSTRDNQEWTIQRCRQYWVHDTTRRQKKKNKKKTKNKKQKTNQQTNKQTNKKHKTKMSITDPTKNGGEPRRPGSVKHCCFF